MRTIVYIDGLNLYDTLPAVQIVLGQFLTNPVLLPRADGKGFDPQTLQVVSR